CRRYRYDIDVAIQRRVLRALGADLARHASGGGLSPPSRVASLWTKRRFRWCAGQPRLSIDQHAAVGFTLSCDQMEVERHQRIEPSNLRFKGACDVSEIIGSGFGEIQRQDHRLGMPRALDVVVERFELANDARMQDNGRARSGARDRQGTAQSTGCAGNENDA